MVLEPMKCYIIFLITSYEQLSCRLSGRKTKRLYKLSSIQTKKVEKY